MMMNKEKENVGTLDSSEKAVAFIPTRIGGKIAVMSVGLAQHYLHPEVAILLKESEDPKYDYAGDILAVGKLLGTIVEKIMLTPSLMNGGDLNPIGEVFYFTDTDDVDGEKGLVVNAMSYLINADTTIEVQNRVVICMTLLTRAAIATIPSDVVINTCE